MRAKSLAKANPRLGLYDSIAAARAEVKRERRTSAISKVLHRKIRSAVDPTTADIAVAVYDLDEIAHRLADGADYAGLTSLIAADLTPARLAVDPPRQPRRAVAIDPTPALTATPAEPAKLAEVEAVETVETVGATGVMEARPVLPPELRRDLEDVFITTRQPLSTTVIDSGPPTAPEPPPMIVEPDPEPNPEPEPEAPPARPVGSLRKRVHTALDEHVPVGDKRDTTQLLQLVTDVLELNDLEQVTAGSYIRSWRRDANGRTPSLT
jgi:hypothetical protein